MKSSVTLAALVLLGLFAVDTKAQEAAIDLNEETSARRAPVMTVAEHTLPVIAPKTAPVEVKKAPTAKKGAKEIAGKEIASKDGAAKTNATPVAPPPMVMSDARQEIVAGEFISTGDAKLDEMIKLSASRNNVDPNLIVAVMRQESGFKQYARSYKGAMGLMQLMPATARRFGVNNPYDRAENIEGGAKYLRFLLDKFDGDVKLVLAGYNAGEGAVVNYGYTVPPYRETRNYVKNISARYGSDKHVVRSQKAAAPRAPEAIRSASRLSNNY
ncbi:MAG: lytic transglycosylase domain-containing protein [Acidobacteriota bacterium]